MISSIIKKINKIRNIIISETEVLKGNYPSFSIYIKFFIIFLFFLWSYYLLSLRYHKRPLSLKVGDISPYDIKLNETITYVDREKTQLKINHAIAKISPIFKLNMDIIDKTREKIDNFFKEVEFYDKKYQDLNNKVNEFYKKYKINKNILKDLFKYYKINYLRYKSINLMISFYKAGVTPISENKIKKLTKTGRIEKVFYNENGEKIFILSNIKDIYYYKNIDYKKEVKKRYPKLRSEKINVLAILMKKFIKPNLFFDKEATDKKILKIIKNISPVKKTIKKGQIIVRYGEEITEKKFNILKEINKYSQQNNKYLLRGKFELLLIFFIIFAILFYKYGNEYFKRDKNFYFIIFYMFILTTISYFTPMLNSLLTSKIAVSFFIPISAVGSLINLLVMSNISYLIVIILSVIISYITELNFLNFFIILLTGIVSVILTSKLKKRGYMWYVGLLIGIFYLIITIALDNILGFNKYQIGNSIIIGFINGILSMMLTIGLFPLFENIFNLLTEYKLLELSDLNLPIMKKLLIEAPGTYNHSILTASLAETAALAINANSLLARVGAYYHDIGKLLDPEYFVENQAHGENKHNKLSPSISASIIKAHIKKGVQLAKKLRLPSEIIDIIEEHHGTTLITFFYDKALKEKNSNISKEELENSFRYPGPKPQTKESAIIMLADSVEAAARALKKPSHTRLETTVRSIIDSRFFDGQLDECPLTLRDLNKIRMSFIQVLSSMFHTRIEYPNLNKNKDK